MINKPLKAGDLGELSMESDGLRSRESLRSQIMEEEECHRL